MRKLTFEDLVNQIGYTDKYYYNGASLWALDWMVKEKCKFLCEGGHKRILDVGSGLGKFCIEGAALYPDCEFVGVELDKDRIECSNKVLELTGLTNVKFIHDSFENIDFSEYDGIFIYNPFNMGGHVIHNEGKYLAYPRTYYQNQEEFDMISVEEQKFKEKRTKINTYISEMEKAFIKKLQDLKIGSRLSMECMNIGPTKSFNYISNNNFEKE